MKNFNKPKDLGLNFFKFSFKNLNESSVQEENNDSLLNYDHVYYLDNK